MVEIIAAAVAAVIAIACVVYVARPFLREPASQDDSLVEGSPAERERVRLAEERDRVLAAIKDLEFDHRTGKISDEDYREQVTVLRRSAAEAIRLLERGESSAAGTKPPVRAKT